ncbi:MAG: hypothetical protein HKN12_09650 [Gemmatimonadetes bacterium]|nr:hypothetical protein [Gemmatimonadota bacterium]
MPKTGGDATWALFQCVPDLVVRADDPLDPRKHASFAEEGIAETRYVLNLRRLPSQVLSWVQHTFANGRGRVPKGTWITPEEALEFRMPDQLLERYLDGGPGRDRIEVSDWLRMEHLRDDFIEFASTLRPLDAGDIDRIRRVITKPPMAYDHNPLTYFTPDQVEELYERNPTWARIETEVYGSLIPEEPADAVAATVAVPAAGTAAGALPEPLL